MFEAASRQRWFDGGCIPPDSSSALSEACFPKRSDVNNAQGRPSPDRQARRFRSCVRTSLQAANHESAHGAKVAAVRGFDEDHVSGGRAGGWRRSEASNRGEPGCDSIRTLHRLCCFRESLTRRNPPEGALTLDGFGDDLREGRHRYVGIVTRNSPFAGGQTHFGGQFRLGKEL